MGEEGLICFVEDLLFAAPELRLAIIRELPYVADSRVVSLLEILLRIYDPTICAEAAIALGKIREPAAVALLQRLQSSTDSSIRELSGKSLRRLFFLGMENSSVQLSPSLPLPYYATCTSPIDGAGNRTLWLCRWTPEDRLASLFIQTHETKGMTASWGNSQQDILECAKQWEEMRLEEGVVNICPDYALRLVNDSIYRCRQLGAFLPAEFYVLGGMFRDGELVPALYTPDFTGYDLPGAAAVSRLIARSSALFEDDYFAGWFLSCPRVYDFAEEWIELEKTNGNGMLVREIECLVERFCVELLAPELESIQTMLFLTADLMRLTGREKGLVEQTLAVAINLLNSGLSFNRHPFLKRFALESMDMAREALAEGYDLREHQYDEDDWE
jgi:hypothetical protein